LLAIVASSAAAAVDCEPLATFTAARPWEARAAGRACAVSVCVAGDPVPPSEGHLKVTTALPIANSIVAARTRVPAVPRPAR
jgi:hypothetical protein